MMMPLPGVARREITGALPSNAAPVVGAPSTVPGVMPSWGVQPTRQSGYSGQSASPSAYASNYARRMPGAVQQLNQPLDPNAAREQRPDENPANMGPSPSYGFLPLPRTPQVNWRTIPQPTPENQGEHGDAQRGHQIRRQMSASSPRQGPQINVTPRHRAQSTILLQPTKAMPSSYNPTSGEAKTNVASHHTVPKRKTMAAPYTIVNGDQQRPQCVPGHEYRPRAIPEEECEDPSYDVKFSDIAILESLGSGEFGHVFRGSWRGREVAVKQLFWDGNCKTDALRELRREVESFRNLKHPRLVKFIGACFEPPHLCMLTEYMSYGSLYHALHVTNLKFPFRNACNMSLQLAEGVTFLHCQIPIVVHRDLKSLNVVLDMHFNIKICDFGLTEIMECTHITKKNNGGSPRYMAPELFDKKSKITEKIDVWAMGCIFAEIFGGKIPYDGVVNLPELTRTILLYKKLPEIPNNENCPPAVQKVIAESLTYDGEQRPRSKDIFDRLRDVKKAHTAAMQKR